MRQLIALLAGTIFGAGLTISGMTNTNKVIGFLDVTGNWDASVIFRDGCSPNGCYPCILLYTALAEACSG